MKKLNDSGIAHLALIIISIVVLAIGVVGWRVYSSSRSDNIQTNTANNPAPSSTTESKPETYEYSEEGISFTYPKSWGDASSKKGKVISPARGDYKQITFNKRTDVDINLVYGGSGSPLDGCPDPLFVVQHEHALMKSKVIGWSGSSVKVYYYDYNKVGYTVQTLTDQGEKISKLTEERDVLVYKLKNQHPVKATPAEEGCGTEISQSKADESNAYFSITYFALNFKTSKIIGVNATYDSRSYTDQTVIDDMVDVLNSFKKN